MSGGNMKGKGRLEDISIEGRITYKGILKNPEITVLAIYAMNTYGRVDI
jgi:hypothetical protein